MLTTISKRLMVALTAIFFSVFFSSISFAFTPPPSPAPASWISDPSHALTDEAHQRLDAKLQRLNAGTANELAALILPTLDGESIEDVGDETAKSWGVGKKGLDNGVLVVLALKEHKSRISTGKGVGGDLPDLKANDILQEARPYLRRNDIEGALTLIFDQSAAQIANHKAETQAKTSDDDNWTLFLVVTVALGLGIGAFLFWRSKRRRQKALEAELTTPEPTQRQEPTSATPPYRKALPVEIQPISLALNTLPDPPPAIPPTFAKRRAQFETTPTRRRDQSESEASSSTGATYNSYSDSGSSSASSSDSSSSDTGSSWDSGGGGGSDFGGGDFGGGGSSSDW